MKSISEINATLATALANLNPDLWSKDIEHYVKDAIGSTRYADILMKVMGEGKTARLLAVATKIHSIYISCATDNERPSIYFENSFAELHKNLLPMSHIQEVRDVHREVLIYYLARFFYLKILVDRMPDLSPTLNMRYQINGSSLLISLFYKHLRDGLHGYNQDAIHEAIEFVLRNLTDRGIRLAVHLDELQIASKLFIGE